LAFADVALFRLFVNPTQKLAIDGRVHNKTTPAHSCIDWKV
jgi:hypothetical protein